MSVLLRWRECSRLLSVCLAVCLRWKLRRQLSNIIISVYVKELPESSCWNDQTTNGTEDQTEIAVDTFKYGLDETVHTAI